MERNKKIDAGQLVLWSHDQHILAWLAMSRSDCHTTSIIVFIDEFIRYIKRDFKGMKDMTMSDHIVSEIVGSPEKVSASMHVISLADSIKRKLLSKTKRSARQQIVGVQD
jgi:hypothetical protein